MNSFFQNVFNFRKNVNIKKINDIIENYLRAILLSKGKKNCSSMAQEVDLKHDKLYKFLENASVTYPLLQKILFAIVLLVSRMFKGDLLIDDTSAPKPYAKKIENLGYERNGSLKLVVKSLTYVVAVWSNGVISIPFACLPWVRKKECKGVYKKKSELAIEIITKIVQEKIKFNFLLMDGAYSGNNTLSFLESIDIKYILRIPKSRTIQANGIIGQLQNHPNLKLNKNKRYKTIAAISYGTLRYFTVHKRKKAKTSKSNEKYETVYYVSNVELNPEEYIERYSMRWGEEMLFRTDKQYLGLGQCQALSAEKQLAHLYASFLSYTLLSFEKNFRQAKCVENIIHGIRSNRNPLEFNGFEHFIKQTQDLVLKFANQSCE